MAEKEKNIKADSKPSISSLKDTMIKIFALSKPYRAKFYFATVVVLIASAIWLTVPLGLRALLDAVFDKGDASLLNTLALGLILLFTLQALFGFLGNYYLEWVGERVVNRPEKKSIWSSSHIRV